MYPGTYYAIQMVLITLQEDEDWLVRAPMLSVFDEKYPTMPASVGDDGYDGFGNCSGFGAWGEYEASAGESAIMGPVCFLPKKDQVSVFRS